MAQGGIFGDAAKKAEEEAREKGVVRRGARPDMQCLLILDGGGRW